ncbi:hypothetical protein AC244_29860 [Ensifer adhaerens]|uniref:MmgE/PrpD family protein n=1 Tax=Ensifer adhaerens TaxID=106592 RepID=A0A0L8BGP5_ENSAD|nr:hypothetical protein [Ensifer adhaerens]KOF13715.1 hypothetical protein AC244_29860 [Ensifer adhaerens]
MHGISAEMVAVLTDAEIDMLRRVFEAICIEYDIPREGTRAEHLARFLMAAFSGSLSTEKSLLAAAHSFYLHHIADP